MKNCLEKVIRGVAFAVSAAVIMSWCSCDRYLDVKSNSALVTPNTVESLQQLLDASQVMNFAVNGLAQASADDHFLTPQTYASISELDKMVYRWENFHQIWDNDWAKGYIAVYQANLALDQLAEIARTPSNNLVWDNVKGSALFFRAHQFLSLVGTYAKAYDRHSSTSDPGIVLRLTSDPTVRSERADIETSYRQIITDLKEAVDHLPALPEHPMRPSVVAAYGLLARTYLSMAEYDSAMFYSERALEIKADLLDYNDPDEVNLQSQAPFGQFSKEIVFYSQLTNLQPTISPYYCFIDSTLYRSYKDNDLRKLAFFTPVGGDYASFKGSYTGSTDHFSGLTTAELLLISAECLVRLGHVELSLEKLNQLAVFRYDNETFNGFGMDTDDKVLSLILSERRKELLMRGLRWMDIKRLNKQSSDIYVKRIIEGNEFVLEPNDARFALPIPSDVVSVTGIPQNEY